MEQGEADPIPPRTVAKALCHPPPPPHPPKNTVWRGGVCPPISPFPPPPPSLDTRSSLAILSSPGERAEPVLLLLSDHPQPPLLSPISLPTPPIVPFSLCPNPPPLPPISLLGPPIVPPSPPIPPPCPSLPPHLPHCPPISLLIPPSPPCFLQTLSPQSTRIPARGHGYLGSPQTQARVSWGVLGGLGGPCSRCDLALARSPCALPAAAVRVLCPVTVSGEIKCCCAKKSLKPDNLGVFGAGGGGKAAPAPGERRQGRALVPRLLGWNAEGFCGHLGFTNWSQLGASKYL